MAAVDLTIRLEGAGAAEVAIEGVRKAVDQTEKAVDNLNDTPLTSLKVTFNGAAESAKALGTSAAAAEGKLEKLGASAKKIGGLIGGLGGALGGVLAAAGVKELIALGEEGGALQAITHRLERLGYTADNTSDLIGRLGGGSITQVEKLISSADQAGLSFEAMQAAADAALQVSIAKGEASHDVYKKLTEAVASGRTQYLKQLGVVVDAKKAEEDYAKSLNLTVGSLTEKQKATARANAALAEINAAFGGNAPDKYASNLGAVTDAFHDLGDEVKRIAGDALSDLGAVLGLLRGGKEASFASDNMASRLQASQAAVKELEAQGKRQQAAVDRLLVSMQSASKGAYVALAQQREAEAAALVETRSALVGERRRLGELEAAEAKKQAAKTAAEQAAIDAQALEERKKKASEYAKEADRLSAARLASEYALRDRELALIQDTAERELAILEEAHVRQLAMFDEQVAKGEANAADRGRLLQLQEEEQAQLGLKLSIDASTASLDDWIAKDQEAARIQAARVAMLEGLVDREIALIQDRDAQALASMEERFRREQALIEKQIADGIASEEDRTRLIKVQEGERAAAAAEAAAEAEKAGKKREEAAAQEASAYAASADAALGAAASLAEALGASAAVIAGINIAKEVAGAASEVAASAASAAVYDYPGAVAHGVAAAAHVAAAVKWGDEALGGQKKGGDSAAKKAPSGGGRGSGIDRSTVRSGDRDRSRPSAEAPINLYFQGQPIEVRSDIQDAVVVARREAYRRRGGARDGGWQRRY